ncbi:MAG TPA: HAD family hydrolase [Fibrobacteria bacterium]|jgi:Cu2+-exporting ATPase|nr:HAD family hydrolase [Fibrobacteria bacterium]
MIAPNPASAATTCTHCGADLLGAGLPALRPDPATDAAARFCCEGCRVVHGILAGEEGGVYYDLLDQSGTRAPRAGLTPEYREYLEGLKDPETLRRIGRWEAGSHALTLECPDMSCAACGWLMERVLGETPGVLDYDVDFVHGEMHIRYDAGVTMLPDVLQTVGSYGYAFKPKSTAAPRPVLDRTAWMRLAVAAACFMNAMAFAFGPYIGFGRGMSDEWVRALGVWTFISALPAVFYSAFPFYQGAWRALRGRVFTIDITVTIGIILAFSVSLASLFDAVPSANGLGHFNYGDTLAGLVFFLLLGRYAVRRFEGGLMLRNRWHEALSPDVVRVRDPQAPEGVRWTPLEQVEAGDLVEIPAGDYLPVDGTVESGEGAVDTAFLTGEDRPRPFGQGDFLFAGWRFLGISGEGKLALRVVNPHARTRAAGLRRSLETLVARKRRRNVRRERVALGFTLVVAASALLALAVHWSSGWEKALVTAAAVFIVSCSCALALAVPVSRGVGLLRAHRLGFHFRDQETLERLGETRTVLFDKTGTLTFTRRRLERWDWSPAFSRDVPERERVLGAVATLTGMSAHPVAMALHAALGESRGTLRTGRISAFAEHPHFGLTGTWTAPEGESLRLCVCRHEAWRRNPEEFRKQGLMEPGPEEEAPAGITPQSCLFVNGRLAAFAVLGEEIKPGARNLLAGLADRARPVLLLSGDHPQRVEAFAQQAGFTHWRGGLSPEQKQAEAQAFQARHGAALAVGDGYNDSLLFGEAAVSLAVQGAAGPVAAEADAFMTTSNPEAILSLLRIAEGTRRSLRNCYIVSGVYNAGALSLAVGGFVSPLLAAILMPIASISLCVTAWLTIPGE